MLNQKERQVIELLAEGKVKKEIAKDLGCSLSNIERIVICMRERYHCQNTVQLVAFALANNLIAVENYIAAEHGKR